MKHILRTPKHVAIIMDGNRRWAKLRGLAVYKGHEVAIDILESIVVHAEKKGIDLLTFWAFSTENWKRNKLEIEFLMKIFRDTLMGPAIQRLIQKGVKINTIGDLSRFPGDVQEKVDEVVKKSKNNDKIVVNLALDYGGREELVQAMNVILNEVENLENPSDKKIDEATISSHLYTAGQPDPDLIIRTGGDQRLSGFLTWQAIYSELYFTDTYWPDFDEKEFDKALADYASRERRFGK